MNDVPSAVSFLVEQQQKSRVLPLVERTGSSATSGNHPCATSYNKEQKYYYNYYAPLYVQPPAMHAMLPYQRRLTCPARDSALSLSLCQEHFQPLLARHASLSCLEVKLYKCALRHVVVSSEIVERSTEQLKSSHQLYIQSMLKAGGGIIHACQRCNSSEAIAAWTAASLPEEKKPAIWRAACFHCQGSRSRSISQRNATTARPLKFHLAASAGEYRHNMENLKNLQTSDPNSFLREFRNACATPVMLLRQIAQAMAAEMQAGLDHPGERRLKMLPTYLECLPTGNERGLYYAVDLGGTNFRVLRVQLQGKEGRIVKQESEEVPIPQEVMTGSSKDLFNFLAETIIHFVSKEAALGFECLACNQQRHIGFTFSFPVYQTKVNRGEIIEWTKGFSISDAVGKDVVEQLQNALAEVASEHTKVICLVNDTVGTLAQCRYWNEDAMVGIILGTGTNACYVERADAIPCWNSSSNKDISTVVNIEWGNFYSNNLPRMFADEGLDKDSLNPGQQEFEKMIGGMYMGEIVRRVLLKMAEETGLFGENVPESLMEPFTLTTPHMSTMHSDDSPGLQVVESVIEEAIGVKDTTLATRKAVYDVCDIIAERGARLSAAGIVGILKKIGRCGHKMNSCLTTNFNSEAKKTVVAIDGSLYEKYTKFRAYMENAMKEMLGEDYADNVTTMLSKDGSGVGAALLAAAISTGLRLGDR